jgi:hypothetical protein
VEEVKFHGEKVWWVAKSISFNSMSQDQFRKFFDDSMDCIVTEVLPGVHRDDLIREVEGMIGFKLDDIRRSAK